MGPPFCSPCLWCHGVRVVSFGIGGKGESTEGCRGVRSKWKEDISGLYYLIQPWLKLCWLWKAVVGPKTNCHFPKFQSKKRVLSILVMLNFNYSEHTSFRMSTTYLKIYHLAHRLPFLPLLFLLLSLLPITSFSKLLLRIHGLSWGVLGMQGIKGLASAIKELMGNKSANPFNAAW